MIDPHYDRPGSHLKFLSSDLACTWSKMIDPTQYDRPVAWTSQEDWPWRTLLHERPFTRDGNYIVLIYWMALLITLRKKTRMTTKMKQKRLSNVGRSKKLRDDFSKIECVYRLSLSYLASIIWRKIIEIISCTCFYTVLELYVCYYEVSIDIDLYRFAMQSS